MDFIDLGDRYCDEAIKVRKQAIVNNTFFEASIQRHYKALVDKADTYLNLAKFSQRGKYE